MKPSRLPSIRSRLVLLTIACMAPAFLLATAVLYHNYQQQRAVLIKDAAESSRALVRLIDREFGTVEVLLSTLATSPSLRTGEHGAFQAQAEQVIKRSFINNIALIAPSGQQLMNTVIPFGQRLPMTGVMAQTQRVVQTGQSEISGLLMGAALKRSISNVAVPVFSGSTVTHSLSGVILPDHFQKLLVSYGLPGDQVVVVFDRSSTIVARSHDIERFRGKTVAPGLASRLQEVNEDTFEVVTLEGIQVVTSFYRSPSSGWGVAIGIPEKSLTADLRRSLAILIGLTVLLLGASLLVALTIAGRIAGAVRALRDPALGLGYGEAVHVQPQYILEIDEVGEALGKASALLQESIQSLSDNEARFRGVVESAMDAIMTANEEGNIVMFNAAAATMFACPVGQAMGLPVTTFVPRRFHAHHAEVLRNQKEKSGNSSGHDDGSVGVTVGLRMNGEEFPAEVSLSSVVALGSVLNTFIIRDVGRRVAAYKALERSNLDLQQFAYVASHDLKTPLRSIAGFVQLLERNHSAKLDEKGLALIQRTGIAVRRLEQLTEDLLSYARIEAEAKRFEPVDMAEVARDVALLLDAPIQTAGAVLTVGDLPVVLGDRTQLAQLLLNLLGNSLKYCRDRAPEVEVSAVLKGREWVFSVKDNGIGIAAKHHEKVFEVFKRLHTQNEYPGTGIGLAVCRRVVEGHGGKIWVTSESGVGSTFSFTLPVYSPEATYEA
ncbi:MAG: ATP-binding protein [Polaromonas sp.]|nr:ATP-binding protein [Polaromonas sp.]MDP3750556.1 ATP-binding protein [Polaromonas sp.]